MARTSRSATFQQAAEIQKGALPAQPPPAENADLAGINAGRWAAITTISFPTRTAVWLSLWETFRARACPGDLGDFLVRLNKSTCRQCHSNRFITFFFCVLDPKTGELRFANAGNNPPVIAPGRTGTSRRRPSWKRSGRS
jgi:hypothetical protein